MTNKVVRYVWTKSVLTKIEVFNTRSTLPNSIGHN